MKRLAKHNAWSRDHAVLYIDGKVLVGSDFVSLLNDYLSENSKMQDFILDFAENNPGIRDKYKDEQALQKDIELAERQNELPKTIKMELGEFDREYGFNTSYSMAFAHECKKGDNKGIYIETNTINCSLDDVVSAIRSKFPGYSIYDDDSCFMTSEDPKDYKEIKANIIGTDYWFVVIDHEVFGGDSYYDAFERYIDAHALFKKFNNYFVENFADKLGKPKEQLQEIADSHSRLGIMMDDVDKFFADSAISMGKPMAFAKEKNNTLFIDTTKLYNVSLNDTINDFKKEYPDMDIYDLTNNERLAFTNLKRLTKRAYHGVNSREKALVYIDGEILSGDLHPDIVQEYLDRKGLLYDVNKNFVENSDQFSDYSDEEKEELISEMSDAGMITIEMHDAMNEYNRSEDMPNIGGLPIGFAHLSGDKIFIDPDSIQNIDLETIANEFKKAYSDAVIYDDSNYEKLVARKLP